MRVEDFEILNEGKADYEAMIRPLLDLLAPYPKYQIRIAGDYENSMKWAQKTLRRPDRVVWFLRMARRELVEVVFTRLGSRKANDTENPDIDDATLERIDLLDAKWKQGMHGSYDDKSYAYRLPRIKERLTHFMGLASCDGIQNYRFGFQTVDDVMVAFERMEEEWKKTRQGEMQDDGATLLMKFPDGFAWYDARKPYCTDEGDAMGHCGNQYDWQQGDTIISLRRKTGGNRVRPSLTFILHANGYLGETKGRENAKPSAKYHDHIIALLKSPLIKGIQGGGYDPQNNFELADLTEEQRQDLYKVKPALMLPKDYLAAHGNDEIFREKIQVIMDTTADGERPSSRDFFQPQWVEHPEHGFVYAFNKFDSWEAGLEILGHGSIRDAIAFTATSDYQQYLANDGGGKFVFEEQPQEMQDKVAAYVKDEAREQGRNVKALMRYFALENEEEIQSLSNDDLFDFIIEEEKPNEIYQAQKTAYAVGTAHGVHMEILEELRPLCKQFGGKMWLDDVDGQPAYFYALAEDMGRWASLPMERSPLFGYDEENRMFTPPRYEESIEHLYGLDGWDRMEARDAFVREVKGYIA